jgi:hypothetical protein
MTIATHFTIVAVLFAAQAAPCMGLIPPSQNHHLPAANSPLSYQASPDIAEDVISADTADLYPSFEQEMGEHEYSILDFLRSKNAGTGHVEEDRQTSYYTLKPDLDMLVDWTLDYVDAIDLAGGMTRVSVGLQEQMAPEFVFCSPTIGPIAKNDFVNLMSYYRYNGLDLASAIPDLTVSYDGWHQDPHDAWRVWAVARYSGTHTGTATLPGSGLKLSPSRHPSECKRFTTGPELQSFLWTPSKTLLWQTVGYIGDRNTGANQGHGSLDGLLVSMGLPPLYLETTEPLRNVQNWFSQFRQAENVPKLKSSYSSLPQWWHERKALGRNIQR